VKTVAARANNLPRKFNLPRKLMADAAASAR
jgi:hypothetical protein